MENSNDIFLAIMNILRRNLGDRIDEYALPPPIFDFMQGQFVAFDQEEKSLTTKFPVLESYLNPYAAMQGGMISAAVDNTLGPLSVLVAPPNLTRELDMTYSKPVTIDMGWIIVKAKLMRQEGQRLFFIADVRNREGIRLARAKAVHWIVGKDFSGMGNAP
jgi:acyl-coenzyme A thioesterase PaaI-like protein